MKFTRAIDDIAQRLEYSLVDAVSAAQMWLVAVQAASDDSERRDAVGHVIESLIQIGQLAAHTRSLLSHSDDERSEE